MAELRWYLWCCCFSKHNVTLGALDERLTEWVDKSGRNISADGFGNLSWVERVAIHQHLTGCLPRLLTLVDEMADHLPFLWFEAVAVFPALELCF